MHTLLELPSQRRLVDVGDLGAPLHRPVVRRGLLSPGSVEHLELARVERLHAPHGRGRSDDEPVPNDRGCRRGVQTRLAEESGREQRTQLGSEGERPPVAFVAAREIQRLDTERVAREEELPRAGIPKGEREQHTLRATAHGVAPVESERTKYDGGIAGGAKALTSRSEPIAQRDVVVDLAVVDEDVPGHGVDHRLRRGGRQIQDRQPRVTEHHAHAARVSGRLPDSASVRAAVLHRSHHASESRAIRIADGSDDARYSAHGFAII